MSNLQLDLNSLLFSAGIGAVSGIIVGTAGYLKDSTSTADENKPLLEKMTAVAFNLKIFLPTVFVHACLGAGTNLLIYGGIPPEVVYPLFGSWAGREFMQDVVKISDNLKKKAGSTLTGGPGQGNGGSIEQVIDKVGPSS